MPDSAPYITLRHGEQDTSSRTLTLRHRGGSASLGIPPAATLAYTDERTADRDHHGILFARMTQTLDTAGWPAGRPDWANVHPARQRECMSEMLCHYCRGQPSQTAAGFLFLDVASNPAQAKPNWPEGLITYQPPLCLPHARKALDLCGYGHRSGGFTALRVQQPRWSAVLGTPYQDSAGLPQPIPHRTTAAPDAIPLDHPQRQMFLGAQYALALHGVTIIDLASELTAAGL